MADETNNSGKRRYYISFVGEGRICGDIWLTQSELAIVKYAINPANWEDVYDEDYSPSVSIEDADEADKAYEL